MSDLTREEKAESLTRWCVSQVCDSEHCRLYDLCPGDWFSQPNNVIDKAYEKLWEGEDKIINYIKDEMKRQMVEGCPVVVDKTCEEELRQDLKKEEAEVNMFDGDRVWRPKTKNKIVVVINGRGGVGKDTCVYAVARKYTILNCSSITPIKHVAEDLGWDFLDKSDRARKFLSDLKTLSSKFNDFPFAYLLKMHSQFINSDKAKVMFVHIREPEEIAKFRERVPECKTLLIESKRVERVFGNMADDNVENYDYDYIYHNDKPLNEVSADFLNFFEKHIMKG